MYLSPWKFFRNQILLDYLGRWRNQSCQIFFQSVHSGVSGKGSKFAISSANRRWPLQQLYYRTTVMWPIVVLHALGTVPCTWDGTGCEFDSLQCRICMFIESTITWVPSGFSGYIWLDPKIVLKWDLNKNKLIVTWRLTHERKYRMNKWNSDTDSILFKWFIDCATLLLSLTQSFFYFFQKFQHGGIDAGSSAWRHTLSDVFQNHERSQGASVSAHVLSGLPLVLPWRSGVG